MKTQKEIAKTFLKVRDVIDFLDDGYHNKDIFHLIEISNELFTSLNERNQMRIRKILEQRGEP